MSLAQKQILELNKSVDSPSRDKGQSERIVCSQLCHPIPRPGGSVGNLTLTLGGGSDPPRHRWLLRSQVQKCRSCLRDLPCAARRQVELCREWANEVCSKCGMASQVIPVWSLLLTDPCGSLPWLRGNGAGLHELRTSCWVFCGGQQSCCGAKCYFQKCFLDWWIPSGSCLSLAENSPFSWWKGKDS